MRMGRRKGISSFAARSGRLPKPPRHQILIGDTKMSITLTGSTCGEACWHAKENVCHCSCGGVNHGCLLSPDGARPVRTAKIDGVRYELKAIGNVEQEAMALNAAAGITYHYAHTARQHYGYSPVALIRPASKSQLDKWPELKAERERISTLPAYDWRGRTVYLLWVRSEAK